MGSPPHGGLATTLTSMGWRQGSLVPTVEGLAIPFLKSVDDASVVADARPVKARERLIVASHACDLERPISVEPYAEVLVCTKERRDYLPRISGSPRSFVIDEETGLVVNAKYRALVEKGVLANLMPEPWPSTDAKLHDFERWLGARYDRGGFSDFANAEVIKPLQHAYTDTTDTDAAVAFALSRAVREVRIAVNEDSQPASVHVLIVIWPSLTPRQADAVDILASAFEKALHPKVARLVAPPTTAPLQRVSAHEYLLTQRISMLS